MSDVTAYDLSSWRCGHYYFDQVGDITTLNIEHPKASCVISLFGGQVLSFTPVGQSDFLWLSQKGVFDATSPIRGGVPVCWPWFGNHHDGKSGKKSHGFARTTEWTLNSLVSDQSCAVVELQLFSDEETQPQFPFLFELKLRITIQEALRIELLTTNTGCSAFEFTGALHSYLSVSDLSQSSVLGLGKSCLDSVDHGVVKHVESPFTVEKAIDYVFANSAPVFVSSSTQLTQIQSEHASSWVVWSPWYEGASKMSDMDDAEYLNMLCIEPAILTQPIVLKSGQTHCLDLTISNQ